MDFDERRKHMVYTQLMSRDITDKRTINAFLKVPRHKFIDESLSYAAYDDHPLQIGEGQTISQPYIVALMTQELDVKSDSKTLEIGTGSGYQTAILAELTNHVYTVERIPSLSEKSKKLLGDMGYENIHFKVGDGTLGWREEGPFDRIIVTAAAPKVPRSLADQLVQKGIMVIPIGSRFSQYLTRLKKKGKKLVEKPICGCIFVRLIGKEGWKAKDSIF